MTTSNITRSPYLHFLIENSLIAEHVEDTIGTDKFEELLKRGTLVNFVIAEKLVSFEDFCQFYLDLKKADKYFEECNICDMEFNDNPYAEFDDDYAEYTNHYRKNRARRHRKALKNEKRGAYRSIPYARSGGCYDKLEKNLRPTVHRLRTSRRRKTNII